jgi:hypothetical protein
VATAVQSTPVKRLIPTFESARSRAEEPGQRRPDVGTGAHR